jgi:hypothetical protein
MDRWGSIETFSDAPTGLMDKYRDVVLAQTSVTESVVLDGKVWCMVKGNTSDAPLLYYRPTLASSNWNISFECYAPQGTDYFDRSLGIQHIGLTASLIDSQGKDLVQADLSYGNYNQNISVRDVGRGAVHSLATSLLPAYQYRNDAEGSSPDRYIVSFQHLEGEGRCTVTVMHTSGVVIGQATTLLPSRWSIPFQLALTTSSSVIVQIRADPNLAAYPMIHLGGWVVDNLGCRGATARYPMIGPTYEYAEEGGRAPSPNPKWSSEQDRTEVMIDGRRASFNATTGRYEADLPLDVQWSKKVGYSVSLDGVKVTDSMYLTMSSSSPNASVAEWWNGLDWVSVFGEDDCTTVADILRNYDGYDHPLTAYMMGSSDGALSDNVEIALHAPHDWANGMRKFWKESVVQAGTGMDTLRSGFKYASKWDDPQNGGKGDTYISMAFPGNSASYELIYALSAAGIKIDGRASEAGAAGNHTHLGSYYYPGGYLDTGSGWRPYTPLDLMDAARLLSWDYPQSWNKTFNLVDQTAKQGGVLRVYGHPGYSIRDPALLHWIDDPKNNYSLENWKATDGEVASYLYGRWSTDIRYNPQFSTANSTTYNIKVKDPTAAGYWKVPITISVNTGGRPVKDIIVQDGDKVLRMSDGTLKDLSSERIMDRGFNLRNGTLLVSAFWTEGSSLTIVYDEIINSSNTANEGSSFLVMRSSELTSQ